MVHFEFRCVCFLFHGSKTSCSVFQDQFTPGDVLRFCFAAERRGLWCGRPVVVGPALPADCLHVRAWKWCEAAGQEEAVHRLRHEPRLHDWRVDWSAEKETYDALGRLFIPRGKLVLLSGLSPSLQVDTPLTVWPSWRTRRIFWPTLAASPSACSLCGCPPGRRQTPWPSGGNEQVRRNHLAWRLIYHF